MPFPSLTRLRTRFTERVDSSARGSDVPAGIERGSDAVAPSGALERVRMRRRLRELRRLREAQLLELGALVMESHRHGGQGRSVIEAKVTEAAATDAEARALADALGTDAGLDSIAAAGIAGPCPTCGTLASTTARFCSECGTPLDGRPGAGPRTPETDQTPLADAREMHAAPAHEEAAAEAGAPADGGDHAPPANGNDPEEQTSELRVQA